MKAKRSATSLLLCGLGLLAILAASACGSPTREIQVQVEQRSITPAAEYRIYAITSQLKNGKSVTCLGLLQGAVAFDPTQFNTEQTQIIDIKGEQQEHTLKELTVGKKLFIAAGFAEKDKEIDPVSLGCQEGEIKAGEKLFLSIFLAILK